VRSWRLPGRLQRMAWREGGIAGRVNGVTLTAIGLGVVFAGALLWAGLSDEAPAGYDVAIPADEWTPPPDDDAAKTGNASPPPPSSVPAPTMAEPDMAEAPEPTAPEEIMAKTPPAAASEPEMDTPEPDDAEPTMAAPPTLPGSDRNRSRRAEQQTAFATLPPGTLDRQRPGVLLPAPLPGLSEETPVGLLPIIAPDGRQPWRVYGRPFGTTSQPKIAIVLVDLGLRRAVTNMAIQLDGAVTLAFAPYAKDLQTWIELARTAGHEVLLQLPMEPRDYPADDPGPQALLTSLTPAENIERLNWHLARFPGYVGVIDYMGERFANAPAHLEPILRVLKNRGLLLFDSGTASKSALSRVASQVGVVTVANDLVIDAVASRNSIAAQLAELERLAKEKGTAVATAHLFPVTLELLTKWMPTLADKGITLAPVSALAKPR